MSLNRSKSTPSLQENCEDCGIIINNDNHVTGGALLDYYGENYEPSDELADSGLGKNEESLSMLKKKLDRMSDMLQEQYSLVRLLKDEISMCTKASNSNERSFRFQDGQGSTCWSKDLDERTKSLLSALEEKQAQYLDLEVKQVVANFLQSDEFKDRVANRTADCVKSAISESFAKAFPITYMPVLDSFHMRLVKYVTRILNSAFRHLEGNSVNVYNSAKKISQSIRIALDKHQTTLQSAEHAIDSGRTIQETLENVLRRELCEWRQKLLSVLTSQVLPRPDFPERQEFAVVPMRPCQPAGSEKSPVEQLLKSADINKRIKEGKINESFELALSASDVSLVAAVCRAAGPAALAPGRLLQPTLLSLAQQLATDMLHDTQLKCRFLEEAITNLNTNDPRTRSHLPLVVGEVQRHLSNFLQMYPGHVASRRISAIIQAANNLLN